MQDLNLYGFSSDNKKSQSPFLDTLMGRLASFMLPNSGSQTSSEIKRRVALLSGISIVGIVALAFFGILAFFQGNSVLGTLDMILSVVLMSNLFDARLRCKYSFNISVGITLTSIFYIYLYINGGVSHTAYVWYYTYPLIAMFLLGSRNGAIATGLMTTPVVFMMVFKPSHTFFAEYHFNFEIRFLFSYIVVGIFSFLIENAAEKNRRDINIINKNLESLMEHRTSELTVEIDKHRKVQERLFKSETRYRTMFEKSAVAVFLVDKNTGNYLDANPAAEALTGRTKTEILALTTHDITPELAQDRLSKIGDGSSSINMSLVKYIRPDGSSRDAILNAVPLGDNLAMGLAQDITDLKKAEDERSKLEARLRHAEKMEAIGTMAGGVAHDLNNILAGIVSYPEMIRNQLPADSTLIAPLQTMEDAGRRAATVVEDLLTLSRNAAAAKQTTDLHLLITDLIDSPEWQTIANRHNHVRLNISLSAQHFFVNCSPVHLKKSIMNLLHNAFEATSPEGNVSLSTVNRSAVAHNTNDEEQIPSSDISITLRDDGPGIPEEHLEHIFEPFYTTKRMGRSGTGLGLSVVWNTIAEHDGTIRVRNGAPGAIFEIFLPTITHEIEIETKDQKSLLERYKGKGTILVVDDEAPLRVIATGMIEMFGYSVKAVSSGEEAVAYLKNHRTDLVFLDMILGEGMNGYETYMEILKDSPQQKAVIVSGFSTSEEIDKTMKLGALSIIKKPYSLENIGKAMHNYLMTDHIIN